MCYLLSTLWKWMHILQYRWCWLKTHAMGDHRAARPWLVTGWLLDDVGYVASCF